jgi:para-aminobenzoate synthetase/4-amino-4-deoxychorismate lyase
VNRWYPLPASLYALVQKTPGTILLESSRPGASSLSRIFTSPKCVVEARTSADIDSLFPKIEEAIRHDHFAAGFFAYECGQHFEPAAAQRPAHENDLLAWFGIYDHCYCFDHHTGDFIGAAPPGLPGSLNCEPSRAPVVSLTLDQPEYSARIAQIHEWIRAGDVYQLNFTFPLHAEIAERPAALYARLRAAQPVDYAAFLHCQSGRYILSLSPELFFRVQHDGAARHITTRPMKGTARRGRTTAEDREIAAWLSNDAKNCAENVMIVDLIRNDLGRICTYGSVKVDKLFDVERYRTLWQMTSTISGDLRPDVNYAQIFGALFPCGSVTGAPKIRSMQLLALIENEPRGIYTGAIGFFSRRQSVFNVAIRTVSLQDGKATMGVGSGIVIDSDPEAEFRECQLKADFLTRLAVPFSLIEAILWDGSFPLLDLHLDRLADSAGYFGFPCDRAAIRAALLAASTEFHDQPRKARLLLDPDGALHIESQPLPDQPDEDAGPARVCISAQRTDPGDLFLFHKTTHRPIYNTAFAAASAAGCADILFLNTRNEVTEGAISNIFIEKDGHWYTPPLDSGVLPGVYRRYLLAKRPNIEEKSISLNDLQAADSVYISNAIRGLRRVTIDFNVRPIPAPLNRAILSG